MRYPLPKERIFFGGLSGLDAIEEKRQRRARKTVCASSRQDFSWLRVNPCIEQPTIRAGAIAPIARAADAADVFRRSVDFEGRGVEHFMVMCLDAKNVPMAVALIHVGGRSSALVDPVSTFQPAVLVQAVGIIIAHNHPSQRAEPSVEDIELTKKLAAGSKILGIDLLDHIVLSDDSFFSFLDNGMLSNPY